MTSRQLAPPAVWGPEKGNSMLQSTNPCSCGRINCSCLCCKHAACLRTAFVLQMHVALREELIGRRPRHWVHEKREVARLRQSTLAAVALITENAPMLWWYAASRSGHHMLDCPSNPSSEEKTSLAEDPAGDATCATTRDMKLSLVRSDAGGNAELGQVQHKINTSSSAETQQHVAQGQQSPRSRSTRTVAEQICSAAPRAQAVEAPGHPPRVMRSGCWQSEQPRPEVPSTNVCPLRCMAGSAGNGKSQRHARSRRLVVARPRPGIQVMSMSKRCLAESTRAIR